MGREFLAGYRSDPAEALTWTATKDGGGPVLVRDIRMASVCVHHLLPFFGVAHVAYVPATRLAGLSKIGRVVETLARRLQIQEMLSDQIADVLDRVLEPHGVLVMLEAEHTCMTLRGGPQGKQPAGDPGSPRHPRTRRGSGSPGGDPPTIRTEREGEGRGAPAGAGDTGNGDSGRSHLCRGRRPDRPGGRAGRAGSVPGPDRSGAGPEDPAVLIRPVPGTQRRHTATGLATFLCRRTGGSAGGRPGWARSGRCSGSR